MSPLKEGKMFVPNLYTLKDPPARWGLGLATEAAQAAFEHATKCRRVRRIVSIAHPDNTASIRIMQKLGFTFEKALDYNERPVVMFAFDVPDRVTP